ncbi:MAG TPA: MBL fold metallo-hydrolase [Acidobacteriaceae bacterium]
MEATLTFLGTGTSMGIPTLGCECEVCRSAVPGVGDQPPASPHNRRTRPSVLISWQNQAATRPPHNVVIDTGPDFHAQAIREGIHRLDAVLYTHGHADHILGMDDLRPLSFKNKLSSASPDEASLPLYADDSTADTLERVFDYTFRNERRYPTSARVEIHRVPSAPGTHVDLFGARFVRVPVTHGKETVTAWRFGAAAYLTDLNDIPAESLALLTGLDVLVLDALRRQPHPTHSTLENSIALVEKIRPRRAFFTHMSHDLDHETTNAMLPPHIRLAYDGLRLTFDIAPETA